MEQYLLLLHERTTPGPTLSPEEIQAMIAKYKAWGRRLHESGRFAGSNKLENGPGRYMRTEAGKPRITDGPFAETKDVIGGYFLIQAGSYDEAVDLCRDCPHMDVGVIEIRRVEVV